PLIEPFRNDPLLLSYLKSFIRHPEVFAFSLVFKYCGPRLKDCRGDEQGAINTFRGRLKAARKSPG
ncbi:hypothetical protein, partial [Candidatus Sordicultor fermentans]|uniref:hypothetical protein n=1 Tax=Candidatus Sordicultor fermentans TaxID=1953203 RepID=UPI0039088DF0